MPRIPVSTAIPKDVWEKAKRSGLKWTQLINLGVMSLDNKATIEEMEFLRQGNQNLQSKLVKLSARIAALEDMGKVEE